MILLVKNSNSSLLGGADTVFLPFVGRTLRVRNYKSLLLTALLIGAVSTALAGTPCGTNLEYEMDGTTLVLTSPDPALSATIDAQAFRDQTFSTTFTNVIIPENVEEINTKAFENCTALTNVVIPPSVTLIGVDAFKGCTSLVSVLCRPQTAPTLGTDAFTGCASGLQICVPALGPYNSTNWNTYEEKLALCFLDENDELAVTEGKISAYRGQSKTSIDLFRTLRKAGCFNTLTLPFSVALSGSPLDGDNVEVYEFVDATVLDGALQLNITPLVGSSLIAGTPYLIQWTNTGEVLTRLSFSDVTWDDDQQADDAGTGAVLYHGFYGRTQIADATSGEQHLNLFLQGNNTLYWPRVGDTSKMLGFRAWFQIVPAALSSMPVYRGMPATLHVVNAPATTTDIDNVQRDNAPCTKVLRNGQIIINRNGESYSITGQKL